MYRNTDLSNIFQAQEAETFRKRVLMAANIALTVVLAVYGVFIWTQARPTVCINSARVITLHDSAPFVCGSGARLVHEKLDDYKVFVECKCHD